METTNGTFTCSNKRGSQYQVASILYRFLISNDILMQGLDVEANMLLRGGSYHWPIILTIALLGTPKN